jgi:hypothetical protein
MYFDNATIEFYAGWNQAAWEIKENGLEWAESILENDLPDRVYNAYISGKRQAAELSQATKEVPLAAQNFFTETVLPII